MNRDTFVCDENWLGSYYELCIELGPTGNDALLCAALEQLWRHPRLHGSWTWRDDYQKPSPAIECRDGEIAPRYGVITLAPDIVTGCVTHTVREPQGSDWLDLCIPTGMLELCFDVQYPLFDSQNPWIPHVDALLAQIAGSVFRSVHFQLAIIGDELSGMTHAASITPDDCRDLPFLFPEPLWKRLGLLNSARVIVPGLVAIGLD